jgi:DNA processing protein
LDEDFADWLRLLETPGVGREAARRLLAACGSPAGIFAAGPGVWRELVGPGPVQALQQEPPGFTGRLTAARRWLEGATDRHALTLGHPDWPQALLQCADPPLLLYVRGRLAALSARSVAVVGSRSPSAQGLDHARSFAAALAGHGYIVVSGLARGIDAAAHEGALEGGGCTVAVMGTGPDRVYPASHAGLADRIAEEGALVTEYPPGMPPLAENFPQRNRIIAGLTLGTLVVEAALRSGSLITARLASEEGREVFAIPGSILTPQARGCHALIRQGAQLVESPQDIIDELGGSGRQPAPSQAANAGPADPLLAALGTEPATLDALMARTGWPASELTARLLDLELEGRVARLPGGLYQSRHLG